MKILSNLPDTDAGTTERPDGAVKDVSSPGAGDGTPFRADWHNDHYYGLLAVMDSVGVAADDSDEEFEAGTGSSQFLDAMRLFVQEWAYPGLDFGLQNISAGNQTSDITIYESGGGSEKEDGFTVRLHWTGGDASFSHSITSAYTIGNELAGFIAANLWIGHGAGELILRLDKTNSKWLVLTPGIWDTITEPTEGFYTIKNIDKTMIKRLDVISISSSDTITFDIDFANTKYVYLSNNEDAGVATLSRWDVKSVGILTVKSLATTDGTPTAGTYDIRIEGFWA